MSNNAVEQNLLKPLQDFVQDSSNVVRRCEKPNRAEFGKVAFATVLGFVVLGVVGFGIKLVHIPINQLLTTPL